MKPEEILRRVDHTLLSPQAGWKEIAALCDEAIRYRTASVCIPPSYAARVREAYPALTVCTVIGFPNGYSTAAVKAFEAEDAVRSGADEIDMVINLGWVKDGLYDRVLQEIREVRQACAGRVLKVIIETCLLTEEEKIRMCGVVSESGADFIKTSTGFSTGGATADDIRLMRAHCAPGLQIKAAGGIRSFADAEEFLALGASRLGTSRLVRLMREMEGREQDAAQ